MFTKMASCFSSNLEFLKLVVIHGHVSQSVHDLNLFQLVEQEGLAGMRVKNYCLCDLLATPIIAVL